MKNNYEKTDFPSQNVILGQYSMVEGDYDRAVMMYRKALDRMPDNKKILLFLANAYFKKALAGGADRVVDYTNAYNNYEKILVNDPEGVIGKIAKRKLNEIKKELRI